MAGRPRGDRAERITATAARLFRQRGFHATSIDDIGRAEGITGGAIYRHFAGKEDLLASVAVRGVRHVGECLAAVDATESAEHRLAETVRAGGRAVLDDLDSIVVYLREGRHLTPEQRAPVVAMTRQNNELITSAVRAVRPELSRREIGFLLQSLAGMYLSRAHFHPSVTRSGLEDIWTTMGTAAVLGAPDLPVDADPSPNGPVASPPRASRRETILAEATTLFRAHGYGGVGIDEIGAAAGIAGPGVYRHFRTKDELLAAAMSRAAEHLAATASAALTAPTPRLALDRLVTSYVQMAVEHADSIAVYLAEVESLSEPSRRAVRRAQRAYVDEWHLLVSQLAPQRSSDEVRAAVHAAIGLVNGYADGQVRPPIEVTEPLLVAMTTSAIDTFVEVEANRNRAAGRCEHTTTKGDVDDRRHRRKPPR